MMTTDWHYSEDRMTLRADVFTALREKYFNLKHAKHLYEFCHHWVSQCNNNVPENIDQYFEEYLNENDRKFI